MTVNKTLPRKGKKKSKRNKTGKLKTRKTPRTRKPAEMSLEQWQVALRREYGREQQFKVKNIGDEPIFSEFIVTNPDTGGEYRVAIRGKDLGVNYCSCTDFAVNTLGTCKHIEFLLAMLERKRGGKTAFKEGFHPSYSEVYLRYGPERAVLFTKGTECPAALERLAAGYFNTDDTLKSEGYLRFDSFLKEAKKIDPGLRCYDDALDFIAEVRDNNRRKQIVDEKFGDTDGETPFEKMLKVDLYPYQRKGALFAARAGRCLIADDMGLGKTIQAIATAEILTRTVGLERVLIVSPTSLKYQWEQEIEKCSGRSAVVIEGLRTARAERYRSDTFYKITNYDVIYRDLDLIHEWAPDLIILDEAQRIKNWKTRTAQSVKKLSSEYAIVLTGTPLENRLEELHSIVEFVDRFHLGPSFRFLAEHQHVDETGRVVGYRNLSKIAHTLKPILIRRNKSEVLHELPERLEKKFFVPMTDQQLYHHEENRDIVAKIARKWRRVGFLTEKEQRILMIALQNMRMSCNSTYLLDQKTDFGVKADELIDLLEEIFEDPEAKVVVFSQWTRTHHLIINRLRSNGSQRWNPVFFHGSVPSKQRRGLIQRFKENPDSRLFLSTDAGGVGLNLQNASVVINMDQPWNPAVLEQRIGRVHRLGQHRPVRIVHFIAQGTIEQSMLSVLAFKKSMFAGVLDGGEDEVFLGGTRLKQFMKTVGKAIERIPESMPTQKEPSIAEERQDEAVHRTDTTESVQKQPSEAETGASRPQSQQEVWNEVLTAGISLLDKLQQAFTEKREPQAEKRETRKQPESVKETKPPFLDYDDDTGESYLRIPMPAPETISKVTDIITQLARNLQQ